MVELAQCDEDLLTSRVLGEIMIRRLTAVAAAGAALMAFTACAASEPRHGTGGPAPDAGRSVAASTLASGGCGSVTYPATGASGSVTVTAGDLSCADAMQIVDRYLNDPALPHSGNTDSAEFDGWNCASPTATAAELYGYTTSCARNDGAEIRVLPAPAASSHSQPLANCDPSAISADLGQRLNVIRCYDGWAYVDSGDLGDAQSLVRLVGDSWTRYTGFPSSICRGKALLQGVPMPELRSFSPC
ncbi:hypothetical protein MHN84_01900 [Mycobacterium sp. PSTR-4-N]|nr:hypothetical protein [Mycobacterium sp. PSTR-4-N]